jgi:hypothetical protein
MPTRVMYLHTIDGKPASFNQYGEAYYLSLAGAGHRRRAAVLVSSLDQIRHEHALCIRYDLREWKALSPEFRAPNPPSANRYGYVLVEVPA